MIKLRSCLRPRAFTLVELVCTLAIVASLLTFAVWNYRNQAVRQRGRTCGVNLQFIEDAKAKFRVDFPGTEIPTDAESANGLRRYFAGGQFPKCPAGGSYTSVTSGSAVCQCSLNVTARMGVIMGGTVDDVPRDEYRAALAAAAADPDEGGDRSANGFHDVGYAPTVVPPSDPDVTPRPAPLMDTPEFSPEWARHFAEVWSRIVDEVVVAGRASDVLIRALPGGEAGQGEILARVDGAMRRCFEVAEPCT